MPLFRRRPRVAAGDYCRDWYDKWVFPSEIAGLPIDMTGHFIDALFNQIQEAGVDVLGLDRDIFRTEMEAVRLEMFGTAYAGRTRSDAALAVAELTATKAYLTERGREDLWERMFVYNQAVPLAVTSVRGEAMGPALDAMSERLARACVTLGADENCAVRAANRVGITAEFGELGATKLGNVWSIEALIEPNEQVLITLGGAAMGFYDSARESLEEVDLHP